MLCLFCIWVMMIPLSSNTALDYSFQKLQVEMKLSCDDGKNNQVFGLKSFEHFQIIFCMTVTGVCLHCEIAHCVWLSHVN